MDMPKITLWGFNGSTYVRTVRMVLAEKGATGYEQVPVNVLKGEPKSPEHLQRHPFGKVPVVDIDGFRVIETPAITRYLNAVLPGASLVPADPKDAARMDMVICTIDSYGYAPLIGGVVAYHLFPDFVGGKNKEMHHAGLENGKKVIGELMRIKGGSPYLAGQDVSIADLYLAPILAYVTLTPHKDEFLGLPGVQAWWDLVCDRESFRSTQP
jgi:glutathione S-transferase